MAGLQRALNTGEDRLCRNDLLAFPTGEIAIRQAVARSGGRSTPRTDP
jgi:hypothetical protein